MNKPEPQRHLAARAADNPLLAKLQNVSTLSQEDRDALDDLCSKTRHIEAKRDVIAEGDRPDHVHLILEGWAARYKVVTDGARQITAYLIPGDFCDLHVAILREMDHSILALTPLTIACIPHDRMEALTRERPELTRALWWATLVDEAVLRAWIVNIGRRDSRERIAHLMCEMHVRMNSIGLVCHDEFDLPLTQEQLADSLGMTSVHASRTLVRLGKEGFLRIRHRRITILDVPGLRRVAGFDPNYLHSKEQVRS